MSGETAGATLRHGVKNGAVGVGALDATAPGRSDEQCAWAHRSFLLSYSILFGFGWSPLCFISLQVRSSSLRSILVLATGQRELGAVGRAGKATGKKNEGETWRETLSCPCRLLVRSFLAVSFRRLDCAVPSSRRCTKSSVAPSEHKLSSFPLLMSFVS